MTGIGPRAYARMMAAVGADSGLPVFVREILRVRPGDRLLDLGCGPGRMFPHLAGVDYVGLDADSAAIARARALHPGGRFEHADASSADAVPRESFDLAVACGLLHHLTDEAARAAISLAWTRLRPGGRLVTLDCTRNRNQPVLSRWLAACDRGRFVRRAEDYLALVTERFENAGLTLRTDLLRFPYQHAIVEGEKR